MDLSSVERVWDVLNTQVSVVRLAVLVAGGFLTVMVGKKLFGWAFTLGGKAAGAAGKTVAWTAKTMVGLLPVKTPIVMGYTFGGLLLCAGAGLMGEGIAKNATTKHPVMAVKDDLIKKAIESNSPQAVFAAIHEGARAEYESQAAASLSTGEGGVGIPLNAQTMFCAGIAIAVCGVLSILRIISADQAIRIVK